MQLVYDKWYDNHTYEVHTPDGTLFLSIVEEDGRPIRMSIEIGKSGSAIRAWTSTVEDLINTLLDKNVGIRELIAIFSSNHGDRESLNSHGNVKSGSDGIVYALYRYLIAKKVGMNRPFIRQSVGR